jgi:hypothetical protein
MGFNGKNLEIQLMAKKNEPLIQPSFGGPSQIKLPAEPSDLTILEKRGEEVLSKGCLEGNSLDFIEDLICRYPEALSGWVALGKIAQQKGNKVEAYAYFRVAYHRGLDKARASGWRGDGRIPWRFSSNRPFLSAVFGLMECADAIGEIKEADRCWTFLDMLDPDHPFMRKK